MSVDKLMERIQGWDLEVPQLKHLIYCIQVEIDCQEGEE